MNHSPRTLNRQTSRYCKASSTKQKSSARRPSRSPGWRNEYQCSYPPEHKTRPRSNLPSIRHPPSYFCRDFELQHRWLDFPCSTVRSASYAQLLACKANRRKWLDIVIRLGQLYRATDFTKLACQFSASYALRAAGKCRRMAPRVFQVPCTCLRSCRNVIDSG